MESPGHSVSPLQLEAAVGSVVGVAVEPQRHSWSVRRKRGPRAGVGHAAAHRTSLSNSKSPNWFVETRVVVAEGSEAGAGCFPLGPKGETWSIQGTTRLS